MKKTLALTLVLVLILTAFAACGTPKTEAPAEGSTLTLASLKGPTTIGLVKLLDRAAAGELDYEVENTIYGTADEIMSLIISGQVDMAAIPANVASVLYNKTEGKIQVAAINTLGVLSVLELGSGVNSIADLSGKTIYSTGKGTTPEFALNAILRANGLDPETDLTIEFKSEATEIAALLSGDNATEGTIAVLPQPYATTVLAQNADVRVALDLTQEWENAGLDGSLVTGVLAVNRTLAEKNPALVNSFLADYTLSVDWVNANPTEAGQLIADIGIVGNAAIAERALPYCNITFIGGGEMKTALSAYLNVLYEQAPASVGGAMPDDNFYYNGK